MEEFSDMIESVRRVVSEWVDGGLVFFAPKPSGDKFEVILEFEVFGLFTDDFLIAPDTSDSHLYADHHIEDHIPVVVPKKDHIAFRDFKFFMHVFNSFLLFLLVDLFIRTIIFLR